MFIPDLRQALDLRRALTNIRTAGQAEGRNHEDKSGIVHSLPENKNMIFNSFECIADLWRICDLLTSIVSILITSKTILKNRYLLSRRASEGVAFVLQTRDDLKTKRRNPVSY